MIKILRNDFFIALLFLLAYMATNAYIYGWDDQHLEIPILKHLIDPSMYQGDYYVESATKYFTSWLYPILAKLITVQQIPAAYLLLFLVSRYVMFYWVYRLWLFVSKDYFIAVCTVLMFLFLGRTDEFLYRSFCHEEFAFMFIFAGLYYFYREKFLVAAIIWGVGANFHAIYSLFPMLYMLTFLLFCHPNRFKMVFKAGIAFVIAALPFLCWQIPISISREIAHPVPASEWGPLYLLACPQNYLFAGTPLTEVFGNIDTWWNSSAPYLLLMGLYIFHLVFNPLFRQDKKAQTIIGLSWALLVVVYFFDYVHPSRFVLDLNLVRVEQFMRFFLMGYTTIWACHQLNNAKPWLALTAAVLVLACGTADLITLFFLGLAAMVYTLDAMGLPPKPGKMAIGGAICLLAMGIFVCALGMELSNFPKVPVFWNRYLFLIVAMGVTFVVLLIQKQNQWLRRLLIIIPLAGSFLICVSNAHEYYGLLQTGPSGWQLQRNWLDMQRYVRDHTPKDAMILTPYDVPMGGFRIHSDRKVVACYRDCGIIGFDYQAAVEWEKRIHDIESLKVVSQQGITNDIALAIFKYHVDYIVFMKYYGPPGDTPLLKKIYENEVFSLFQVI